MKVLRFPQTPAKYKGKVVEILPNNEEVIRPLDLSITKNVASLLISAILILWIFLEPWPGTIKKRRWVLPKGFQGAMEVVVVFIQNEVIKPCIGKDYRTIFTLLAYLVFLYFDKQYPGNHSHISRVEPT